MSVGGTDSASRGGDLLALKEALDHSLDVALSCLSAVESAERACELERLAGRFDALRSSTLAAATDAADGPGAFKALGFRHAIDLVADSTKADPKALRRCSKLGAWLIEFPVFFTPLAPVS